MRGTNELILNEATMMEIVQQWYNRTVTEKAVVTGVKVSTDTAYSRTFVITLEEQKEKQP